MSGYALKTSKPRMSLAEWSRLAGRQLPGWFPGHRKPPGLHDPTAGCPQAGTGRQQFTPTMALSTDGLMWRDVDDPTLVHDAGHERQTVFHFKDRCMCSRSTGEMRRAGVPEDGMPASTSTPVATGKRSTGSKMGRRSCTQPAALHVLADEVVVVDDAWSEPSERGLHQQPAALDTRRRLDGSRLLPPGVLSRSYLHGWPSIPFPSSPGRARTW